MPRWERSAERALLDSSVDVPAPDADLTAMAHASMPLAKTLGLEIVSASAEEVRARLPFQDALCTAGGILHGGALMSLADAAGAYCAFLNLPDGSAGTATIESKTNFFRAVRDGHVDATSRPLHRGRTTIVVETDLRDAAGKHVARVTQTQAVLAS
jgi:1,4-dihydroxy-2-naphthoyl-CoA hydrolase